MRLKKILGCVGLILLANIAHFTQSSNRVPADEMRTKGKLVGMVKGQKRTTLIIEREGMKSEIQTTNSGRYEIELSPGVYEISTAGGNWYFPFRRAAFRISPNTVTNINVVPALELTELSTSIKPDVGFVDLPATKMPPKYETFIPPQRSQPELDLLIRYEMRSASKDIIKYSKAMVSYNTLTIYADNIKFNKRFFRVEAGGNDVIVEDGQQRIRVKRAIVVLQGGKPVITLTKGAIVGVKGKGFLNNKEASFNFNAMRDASENLELHTANQLAFTDLRSGLALTSNWSFIVVTNDLRNEIRFEGNGCLSKTALGTKQSVNRCEPVSFFITVHGNRFSEKKDKLFIKIPGLNDYSYSGTISQGNIEILRN